MERKSQHYWSIHRNVAHRAWREITPQERMIIAADVKHETREFKRFEAHVNNVTQRLYEDPEFAYNAPETFKVPYYQ